MKIAVRKRRAPSIIIVSLVDILTILLIFFVVSTTFKRDQPEVQINLPDSKTSTKSSSELEHAIVSVNENDEVRLDGQVIAPEELETAVRNLPVTRRASLAERRPEDHLRTREGPAQRQDRGRPTAGVRHTDLRG